MKDDTGKNDSSGFADFTDQTYEEQKCLETITSVFEELIKKFIKGKPKPQESDCRIFIEEPISQEKAKDEGRGIYHSVEERMPFITDNGLEKTFCYREYRRLTSYIKDFIDSTGMEQSPTIKLAQEVLDYFNGKSPETIEVSEFIESLLPLDPMQLVKTKKYISQLSNQTNLPEDLIEVFGLLNYIYNERLLIIELENSMYRKVKIKAIEDFPELDEADKPVFFKEYAMLCKLINDHEKLFQLGRLYERFFVKQHDRAARNGYRQLIGCKERVTSRMIDPEKDHKIIKYMHGLERKGISHSEAARKAAMKFTPGRKGEYLRKKYPPLKS